MGQLRPQLGPRRDRVGVGRHDHPFRPRGALRRPQNPAIPIGDAAQQPGSKRRRGRRPRSRRRRARARKRAAGSSRRARRTAPPHRRSNRSSPPPRPCRAGAPARRARAIAARAPSSSAKPAPADRAMQRADGLDFAGDLVSVDQFEDDARRVAEQRQQPLAVVSPSVFGSSSGITHMPALTRPTLRPEPPKPISAPSSTATAAPPLAACSAAERPVKPAPTMATSQSTSPRAQRRRRCRGGLFPQAVAQRIAVHARVPVSRPAPIEQDARRRPLRPSTFLLFQKTAHRSRQRSRPHTKLGQLC